MTEPTWLIAARADVGQRETLGPNDSPWIRKMLAKLSGTWLKGQPWCGGAVAYWMQIADLPIPKAWYRAKAWLDWGVVLTAPRVGCVVVFERTGGGHVGLVVGRDTAGRLIVLGGNQGDAVNERAFTRDRVLGYRWPAGALRPHPDGGLPLYKNGVATSTSES